MMTEHLQNFIESLREELRHYGELLALLDAEQDQVVRRQADALLSTVQSINAEGEAIQVARRERAQRQRELAQSLELPADARIATLVPVLSQAHRPLIKALVEESNQLLVRVRQRARQNHILLSRSLELMEKFINSFCAVGVPTYNESGAVAAPAGTRSGFYEGLG
jgi:flagellar biosynthesis/type III secretory pathway chaperone